MGLISLFFIAIGLSMDAFAVSITNGIMIKKLKIKDALKIGIYFGVFQGIMPIIGWATSMKFRDYIINLDHWIAFFLLGFIGGKMIYESLCSKEDSLKQREVLSDKMLFFMAIATSIDALAIGISFAFLKISIVKAAALIGIVTFIVSVLGVILGKTWGRFLKKYAEIVGGLILIFIGIKIVIEHLGLL